MEIIEQRRLDNNMTLTVSDQSKKMAGDRWLIRIVCEVAIPVVEEFFSCLSEEDPDLTVEIRKALAGEVRFSVVKGRTFVSEPERPKLVELMIADIMDNMVPYLNRAEFPKKLFVGRYAEIKKACVTAAHYRCLQEKEQDEKSDEGPADFSACFKAELSS